MAFCKEESYVLSSGSAEIDGISVSFTVIEKKDCNSVSRDTLIVVD